MKNAIYVAFCSIFGIFVIATLYALSTKPTKHKNSFQRLLLSEPLDSMHVLDLKYNGYYIAGLTKKTIYLGNDHSPNHVLITNCNLTDTQYVKLYIRYYENLASKKLKITIDSPNIFIRERTSSTIFQGTIPRFQYTPSNLDLASISKLVTITPSTIVIRTYDYNLEQNILQKVYTSSPPTRKASFTLAKQVDGVFCTDGTLLYNSDLAQILYIYRYRNQFVGLDTTLNVIYKGKTIDTVSYSNIKTHTISSENKIILASQPTIVNQLSAIDKNRLYINSGLIADNELKEKFDQNSVIDVYSLKNQDYQFSFYLPAYDKSKMYDFKILDNKVIALYDHYIVTYSLNVNNPKDITKALKIE